MSLIRIFSLLLVSLCCPVLVEAQTLTNLFSFSPANGSNPYADVIQATDGNFYGTTNYGGSGYGTIFRSTSNGALTTLVKFNSTNGSTPNKLIQATDGNFYGTTYSGGASGQGTAFRLAPDGTLTTLISFYNPATGDFGLTAYGPSALVQGSDGNFYGTTELGGSSNLGTVFRLTSAGVLTTLVSFTGTNGQSPKAGLVQASDGNFYGTTSYGGSGSQGTVFRMTLAGALTTVVNFNRTNGQNPEAPLIQAKDGNLYGTTTLGGQYAEGIIFRLTLGGSLKTMATIVSGEPEAPVVEGSDGNFYGTTLFGGTADHGTIFQVTPAGQFTTLVSFTGPNGHGPWSGLTQGSDGYLYGTTSVGGDNDYGLLYKLAVPSIPTTSTDVFNGSSLGGGYYYSSWFGIYNSQFYPWIYRTDLGFVYVDPVGSDIYLYVVNGNSSPMGWLYTNSTIYPNVYSFSKTSFLYFFSGSTTFANYTTGQFETY